ncbi:hypothetical protein SAMN05444000_12711 [Shimia gijangensis]|uniref:Polymerase/histidinol phosphatase N-terminal domain-containing protein n=1 Tax=Shimia gijangensis TaxID=1470563 RepID=A0A1M6RZ95_9RHOB|nr:CehA/McbA family metallohydrolase [Shimia gijangensis]SHK37882.1 hypothetical protein SAMN05444000_12711 [Shimia gijangensis]
MILSAFKAPGKFYRGNLHTHSTLSDGCLDPKDICQRYRDEGYDFLCLSDHFVGQYGYPIADTTPYRTEDFTTILGAELHSGAMANGALWHILAVGLPADFAPPNAPGFEPVEGQESGPDIARRARAAGAFVTIAHPQWSGLTVEDARGLDAAHAVEIYNHECALSSDRPDGAHMLETLLSEGRKLTLIAADDAHSRLPDEFGGWVMVKATSNEPGPLLEALKRGDFYASQGPELFHVEIAGDEILITCSEVSNVFVQGYGPAVRAKHGARLTNVRLPLERFKNCPWIRVTVIDKDGKHAWSNPIWL